MVTWPFQQKKKMWRTTYWPTFVVRWGAHVHVALEFSATIKRESSLYINNISLKERKRTKITNQT